MSKAKTKRSCAMIKDGEFEGQRLRELTLGELMTFRRFVYSGGTHRIWRLLVRKELEARTTPLPEPTEQDSDAELKKFFANLRRVPDDRSLLIDRLDKQARR